MSEKETIPGEAAPTSDEQSPQVVLRELHRLQRRVAGLRDQIERSRRSVTARQRLLKDREQELESVRQEKKALLKTIHEREVDSKIKEERLRELQVRLNQCKNNKEYQLLLQEQAAQKAALGRLEDETLELLERVDQITARIEELERELDRHRQELAAYAAEQEQAVAKLTEELTKTQQELQQAEARLPSDLRETYARLVRHLGPEAIAIVERRGQLQFACLGCHNTLPIQVGVQLCEGQWVQCPSCGRLVYLDTATGHLRDTT